MPEPFSHPAVFSFSRRVAPNDKVTGSGVAAGLLVLVEEIQQWACRNDYLVGHIKAFAEKGGQTLRISATKGPPDVHKSPGWENIALDFFTINLAAIIFGPDNQQLGRVVTSSLEEWIDKGLESGPHPRKARGPCPERGVT